MIYIEAPNLYEPDRHPAIFLAGGITACEDWQADVVAMLGDAPVTILNPRRADFDVTRGDSAAQQVAWEYQMLHAADVTLFWFPRCVPSETVQPIALFELGSAIAEHRALGRRFVVGAHPDYPRRADIVLQLGNAIPWMGVYDQLDAAVEQALYLAKKAWFVRG